MVHQLYASVEEMLAPDTLSRLTGQPVAAVQTSALDHGLQGISGAALLHVEIGNGAETNGRYVLKRLSAAEDWLMQATGDSRCRAVTLWQSGLLDRLQPELDHAIVAGAYDGQGWAILMRDVGQGIPDEHQPRPAAEMDRILDGLAAMHAAFWQAPEPADPTLALCDCAGYVTAMSPQTARRLPSSSSPIPKLLLEGWSLLREDLAPDVSDILAELMADPQPLAAALARYPATLLHGDYRVPNLALPGRPPPTVVALDWGQAGRGAATIDLTWLLDRPDVWLGSLSTEKAVAYYRQRLAERLGSGFDDADWQAMWELGMLVSILRIGCLRAWFARHPRSQVHQQALRQCLDRYDERIRAAARWL